MPQYYIYNFKYFTKKVTYQLLTINYFCYIIVKFLFGISRKNVLIVKGVIYTILSRDFLVKLIKTNSYESLINSIIILFGSSLFK